MSWSAALHVNANAHTLLRSVFQGQARAAAD
jgi:hypothetical protein